MSDPPSATTEKSPGFARQAAGLLEDFWKDQPCEFPAIELKLLGHTLKIPNILKPLPPGSLPPPQPSAPPPVAHVPPAPAKTAAPVQRWHALPGELGEKMWGEWEILPAGDVLLDMIIAPLGIKNTTNMLNLSAGLGGSMLKLAPKVAQIKGFETDAAVAARGMELITKAGKAKIAPIEAYDPAGFSMPAIYNCMIARELFYRVFDKDKFFYSIGAGIKTNGQVAFTDYIVNPEHKAQPAIAAWQAHEPEARPLGLIEMAEAWAKVGFEIRASEDQTDFYRKEIVGGINRFVAALSSAPPPDADTKKAILREVEAWIHRLAAIQGGMKFYRFQAVKS